MSINSDGKGLTRHNAVAWQRLHKQFEVETQRNQFLTGIGGLSAL